MTIEEAALQIATAVTKQFQFWEMLSQRPSLPTERALICAAVYKEAVKTLEAMRHENVAG